MQLDIIRRPWRVLCDCLCNSSQALGKTITPSISDSHYPGRGSILELRWFAKSFVWIEPHCWSVPDTGRNCTERSLCRKTKFFVPLVQNKSFSAFLGAFTELWKEIIGFVMSVCLSVRPSAWNNSAATGQQKIWYLSIFRKSAAKIQVSVKSGKNEGYFTWRPICIFYHIALLEWEMCQIKVVQKIKTNKFINVFQEKKKSIVYDSDGQTTARGPDAARLEVLSGPQQIL